MAPPQYWILRDAFTLPANDILNILTTLSAQKHLSHALCLIDMSHHLSLEVTNKLSILLDILVRKGVDLATKLLKQAEKAAADAESLQSKEEISLSNSKSTDFPSSVIINEQDNHNSSNKPANETSARQEITELESANRSRGNTYDSSNTMFEELLVDSDKPETAAVADDSSAASSDVDGDHEVDDDDDSHFDEIDDDDDDDDDDEVIIMCILD